MVLSDGLIGNYSFDSDYSDSSGNLDAFPNSNGTPVIETISPLKVGAGVLDLTASNSSIYGVSVSTFISNYPFTLEAWVYLPATGGNRNYFYLDGSGFNAHIGLFSSGSRFQIHSGGNTATMTYDISSSTWYHIVCVCTSTSCDLYVDGTYDTSTTPTTWDSKYNTLTVGMYSDGLQVDYAAAYIDEFRVWNRALDSSEVTELFNSGDGLSYADIAGGGSAPTVNGFGSVSGVSSITL